LITTVTETTQTRHYACATPPMTQEALPLYHFHGKLSELKHRIKP